MKIILSVLIKPLSPGVQMINSLLTPKIWLTQRIHFNKRRCFLQSAHKTAILQASPQKPFVCIRYLFILMYFFSWHNFFLILLNNSTFIVTLSDTRYGLIAFLIFLLIVVYLEPVLKVRWNIFSLERWWFCKTLLLLGDSGLIYSQWEEYVCKCSKTLHWPSWSCEPVFVVLEARYLDWWLFWVRLSCTCWRVLLCIWSQEENLFFSWVI